MAAGSNCFGQLFQWTSFGESHGPAMGVVIDGCPAGVRFDEEVLKQNLQARRPGAGPLVSARQEPDQAEVLSGVYQGLTLGTPIALLVRNQDARPHDYKAVEQNPRQGHADDLWKAKFHHSDPRGGGRASARETVNWVMAGSVAQMLVQHLYPEVRVESQLLNVGPLSSEALTEASLQSLLDKARAEGESYGARIQVEILSAPQGLGQPIFNKFKAELSHAYMSLNAVAAVSLGDGWQAGEARGSEFHRSGHTTGYGGVRGGLSTGEALRWTLSFKPTSSLGKVAKEGRHDPCVALRAAPIIKAMSWSVLADQILLARLDRI